jgi:hypothetical protein
VFGGQRLQLGGHGQVLAERQPGDRTVLQRHQPQLLEPGAFRSSHWDVVQVGVRRTSPQRQRMVELTDDAVQFAGSEIGCGDRP